MIAFSGVRSSVLKSHFVRRHVGQQGRAVGPEKGPDARSTERLPALVPQAVQSLHLVVDMPFG